MAKLADLGVTRFDQIAGWSEDEATRIDEQINGRGRVQRDRWTEQAGLLASGDIAAYEARFGKV